MEEISIITKDGIGLKADYYRGTTHNGVICLHQYNTDRHTFDTLAQALQQKGYHVLTLDLRGHGKSQGNLASFTDTDFKNMFKDAMAADEWLRNTQNVSSIQMIGASIGANTALMYQEMNTLESVIAISPGLNYHGINPQDSNMSNIAMPVFYINSQEDPYVEETKKLYNESPLTPDGITKLTIYPQTEHGMNIINTNDEAFQDVISWIDTHAGKGLAEFK